MCGEVENPKFEARNPKQRPMIKIQMTKTVGRWVSVLNIDAFVNIHDTEMLSPPRMKIGTLCQAKGAAVMRSNFL